MKAILARLAAGALVASSPLAPAYAALSDWSVADAQDLLGFVQNVAADGLDPADYEPAALAAVIKGNDPTALDDVATRTFGALAHDLIEGHVREANRSNWFINGPVASPAGVARYMDQALVSHEVPDALEALSPSNAQYYALKIALSRTPRADTAKINMIRINMERWRWMPRDLGAEYILVNVPAFDVLVVGKDQSSVRHRVIVGKRSTPTPQFSTYATGVIINPVWDVPDSIIRESIGAMLRANPAAARAKGYVASSDGGVLRVRQLPGPGNALGQMKLVMPNPFTIYIHDTPTKALFDKDDRALSHGCIRTDKALDFAALMLRANPGWDRSAVDRIVTTAKTVKVDLDHPVAVYIAYFTVVWGEDGTVHFLKDIYGRDRPISDALNDRPAIDESSDREP
jgi:L,D-transpeptidase YcbB